MKSRSTGSIMVDEHNVQQIELLTGTPDSYGGVSVEIKNPIDSNLFGDLLRASISQWRQQVLAYLLSSNLHGLINTYCT